MNQVGEFTVTGGHQQLVEVQGLHHKRGTSALCVGVGSNIQGVGVDHSGGQPVCAGAQGFRGGPVGGVEGPGVQLVLDRCVIARQGEEWCRLRVARAVVHLDNLVVVKRSVELDRHHRGVVVGGHACCHHPAGVARVGPGGGLCVVVAHHNRDHLGGHARGGNFHLVGLGLTDVARHVSLGEHELRVGVVRGHFAVIDRQGPLSLLVHPRRQECVAPGQRDHASSLTSAFEDEAGLLGRRIHQPQRGLRAEVDGAVCHVGQVRRLGRRGVQGIGKVVAAFKRGCVASRILLRDHQAVLAIRAEVSQGDVHRARPHVFGGDHLVHHIARLAVGTQDGMVGGGVDLTHRHHVAGHGICTQFDAHRGGFDLGNLIGVADPAVRARGGRSGGHEDDRLWAGGRDQVDAPGPGVAIPIGVVETDRDRTCCVGGRYQRGGPVGARGIESGHRRQAVALVTEGHI